MLLRSQGRSAHLVVVGLLRLNSIDQKGPATTTNSNAMDDDSHNA